MSRKIFFLILLFAWTITMIGCGENVMEKRFQAFIKTHLKEVEPLMKELNLSYWEAAISGKKEDYDKYADLQLKLRKIYSNPEEFAELKEFKDSGRIKKPLLSRQLTLLYNSYLGNQIEPELLEKMVQKSTQVESKFNVFRGKMDGQEVTNNQILEILRKETDSVKRRKAWEASKQVGQEVTTDLIKLVKMRNQAAHKLGFDNYYIMSLTLAEQKEEELVQIFQQLKELTDQPFKELKTELDSILAQRYAITPKGMQPWHYHDPFFQEPPQVYEVNLDKYFEGKDILQLAHSFYAGIGLPVDDILQRSDLYEKPGKVPHAFCTDIDRKGDVRVLANIRDDEYWMGTMLHELGHGVYDKYLDFDLPFLLRGPAHTFTTEAIAMFFERLSCNANWLKQMVGLSESERQEIEASVRKSQRLGQLVFARWCQVMFHFERALYRNPDQDLNTLWWDLVEKYQLVQPPEGRDEPDWSAKIHFTMAPVYYHNYMLGELMASQLHHYIVKDILKDKEVSFTNHPEVGNYLKEKIFRPGGRYFWNDLLKHATGEPLNPKYFVEQFVKG